MDGPRKSNVVDLGELEAEQGRAGSHRVEVLSYSGDAMYVLEVGHHGRGICS